MVPCCLSRDQEQPWRSILLSMPGGPPPPLFVFPLDRPALYKRVLLSNEGVGGRVFKEKTKKKYTYAYLGANNLMALWRIPPVCELRGR